MIVKLGGEKLYAFFTKYVGYARYSCLESEFAYKLIAFISTLLLI